MSKPNWAAITAKLPTGRSSDEKAKRLALFKQFDPNGNGFLSLAEVDKGMRDVLALYDLFDAKPVVLRAFNAAKSLGTKKGVVSKGDDYVDKLEFRMLLVYLANYLRIWEVFTSADSSGDSRLSKEEFTKIMPKLQEWVGQMSVAEAWARFNSDGGDLILFTEFADAAIKGVLANDNPEE
jgi:Ca2+-binding EF-hand superfamily protein